MSLDRLDDHYNQLPYRYERDRCTITERKPGQRWNYPFLFNREAVTGHWWNTQLGHRNFWFIGGKNGL